MNPVIREFRGRVEAGANVALIGSALPSAGAEVLGDVAARRTLAEAHGAHAFCGLLAKHAEAVKAGSPTGAVASHGTLDGGTRGVVEVRISTLLHAAGNSTLVY